MHLCLNWQALCAPYQFMAAHLLNWSSRWPLHLHCWCPEAPKRRRSPDAHVWVKPRLHTHKECGSRFHPLLHTYTVDCPTAPLGEDVSSGYYVQWEGQLQPWIVFWWRTETFPWHPDRAPKFVLEPVSGYHQDPEMNSWYAMHKWQSGLQSFIDCGPNVHQGMSNGCEAFQMYRWEFFFGSNCNAGKWNVPLLIWEFLCHDVLHAKKFVSGNFCPWKTVYFS